MKELKNLKLTGKEDISRDTDKGRRNDFVFYTAIEFIVFKQYMICFEQHMGNFGQAMAVAAVPLPM